MTQLTNEQKDQFWRDGVPDARPFVARLCTQPVIWPAQAVHHDILCRGCSLIQSQPPAQHFDARVGPGLGVGALLDLLDGIARSARWHLVFAQQETAEAG